VAGTLAKPVARPALRALLRRTPERTAPAVHAMHAPSESELALALAQGELAAAFQPKVTLRTGAVKGVEALARWHVSTARFCCPTCSSPWPKASGLIVPLTAVILQQSFAACRRWQRR